MIYTLEFLLALAKTDGGTFALDEIIGKLLGKEPQLVEWWAWHDDGDGGSIVMSGRTRVEVVDWLAKLDPESRYKHYVPKPFYRYPAYSTSLDTMATAEAKLCGLKSDLYANLLFNGIHPSRVDGYDDVKRGDPQLSWPGLFEMIHASALQRACALILTMQPL